jgi:hypothetical protein
MQPTSHTRRRRGLVAAAIACSALVLGALGAAPSASAASTVNLTGVQANATVGVNQYLTVTANYGWSCGSVDVTSVPVQVFGNVTGSNQLLGTATFQSCSGSTYKYLFPWAPSSAGTWYVFAQAYDGTQSASLRSAVATGATTTTVSAPNTAKLGQPTTVYATVAAANGGTFSAQGTVTFSIVGGAAIGTATLNNAVPSVASIAWTPATLGTVALQATYAPINPPQANYNCGGNCTSAADVVSVTSTGVNVYLTNPPSLAAGVPSTLTAIVSAVPSSGTITFTVNGAAISSGPVPASGTATTVWTPPAPGTYTLAANWNGTSGLTGSSQETVTVGAAPTQADQIVIVTSAGTTLVPGSTYQVPNGTSLTFTSSTASGSALAFTESGPCSLTSNTFTVPQGNGTCTVTASSPGGNGYAPATAAVTATLIPGTQTAKLAAPASGNINVGKTITLQKASQGKTNAGQTISWKITSGKGSVCSLSFPSNGAVKLKLIKKGTCKVQANAKAVDGQWNKYQKNWKYKGV